MQAGVQTSSQAIALQRCVIPYGKRVSYTPSRKAFLLSGHRLSEFVLSGWPLPSILSGWQRPNQQHTGPFCRARQHGMHLVGIKCRARRPTAAQTLHPLQVSHKPKHALQHTLNHDGPTTLLFPMPQVCLQGNTWDTAQFCRQPLGLFKLPATQPADAKRHASFEGKHCGSC
jgi:hypothetical protein